MNRRYRAESGFGAPGCRSVASYEAVTAGASARAPARARRPARCCRRDGDAVSPSWTVRRRRVPGRLPRRRHLLRAIWILDHVVVAPRVVDVRFDPLRRVLGASGPPARTGATRDARRRRSPRSFRIPDFTAAGHPCGCALGVGLPRELAPRIGRWGHIFPVVAFLVPRGRGAVVSPVAGRADDPASTDSEPAAPAVGNGGESGRGGRGRYRRGVQRFGRVPSLFWDRRAGAGTPGR